MSKTTRGYSLSVKLTAAYSVLILLVSSVLTLSLYFELRATQRSAIRERLHDIISFAVPLVDSDYHGLIITPQDQNGAYYEIVFSRLKSIETTSKAINRVYTIRPQKDGSLIYIVDTTPNLTKRAKVGQNYQNNSPWLTQLLQTIDTVETTSSQVVKPVIEDGLYTRESGEVLLRGYALIIDQFGHVNGILGVELDATSIIASERHAMQMALFGFLVTVPLSLLLGWWLAHHLTSPVIDLVGGAERVAQGNLDQTVPVRSYDELGVLAESFNTMQAGLRQSRLQLENYTRTLAEERTLLRTLIDTVPDYIYIKDTECRFLLANSMVARSIGVASPEELIDKTDFDFLSLELAHQFYAEDKGIMASGQAVINREGLHVNRVDGTSSWLLTTKVPFRDSHGKIVGLVGLNHDVTDKKQAEQERLRLLAIEQELTIAQAIQQSLLPPQKPDWLDLDVVCYNVPAREVGGDLYAYYAFSNFGLPISAPSFPPESEGFQNPKSKIPNPKYAVAVGDVSGKGMPAALMMAISLASLQAAVKQKLSPSDLLAHLDNALTFYTKTTRQNCAMCYVDFGFEILEDDPKSQIQNPKFIARAVNAGCVSPLLKRFDGTVEWLEIGGMPLGVGLGAKTGYQQITLNLSKGDFIILTSDGIVEAMNESGEMFGFERLEQVVRNAPFTSAEPLLEHLKQEVLTFTGEAEQHDDMTVVIIGITNS